MSADASVPSVSMVNTKKEMLEAYTELKTLLRHKEQELLDARKLRVEQKRDQTAAAAAQAVATDPVVRIADLKRALVAELSDLSDRFAAEHERYRALCAEIEEKQAELKRIFEVETAAIDLAALLQAHKAEREKFAVSMAQHRAELETEMAARKAQWKDEAAQFEQKRKREREEHDYEWKRELSRKQTELQDRLADLTNQIQAKQAAFDEQVEARERDLTGREDAVTERERTLDELRARVEAFPHERDEAVARAIKETTSRLQAEHGSAQKLLTREFEGKVQVLESRIASLTDLVSSQVKQIEVLTGQQERAYEKVQDIASKAVAGATRTIITSAGIERGSGRRGEDERE
jgi:hypothetical protein